MGLINPVNKSFCLQTLCEANFLRLLRLAPKLERLEQETKLALFDNNVLHITHVYKAPYTLSFTLTVCDKENNAISPGIKCRLYLDTRAVDVISIEHLTPVHDKCAALSPKERMDNRWALNYFLDKWLSFYLSATVRKQDKQAAITLY